jgi:NTE family protein
MFTMPRPKIGLALGSGGARGLAHAGVLRGLHDAGVRIDVVAGTSMGAIVGALYADEPDPRRVWQRLDSYVSDSEFADYWAAFVPRRDGDDRDEREESRPWTGLFDFMHRGRIAVRTVATRSAEDRDRLAGPLGRLFDGVASFADLDLPFAAVALDLVSGAMVVYDDGDLIDGLYASCAIPGVFPPVEQDGKVICDGGGPFRVPVEACRALGADFVIAVDIPGFLEPRLRTGFDLGMRSNAIARDRLNEYVCASADAVIRPRVDRFHWADFKSGAEISAIGETATRDILPTLRRRYRLRRIPLLGRLQRLGTRLREPE